MKHKCLYCYKELASETDFHEKCSLAFFGTKEAPKLNYSFEQMTDLAKNVVERSISVPGVQPKLSMTFDEHAKDQRLTVVGALGGNYIFKPPSNDFPEMPANEHLTMRLAEHLKIKTVPSSLIRLNSGELSYITKRIDRTEDGKKIHMLDMFQITEAFDKYKSSMEKIGKALGQYSSNTLLDKLFFFEITVFSFLTGNNDMHLKNFSMIETNSNWILAPAYDLLNVAIVNPEDKEELALTLGGKKNKLSKEDFIKLGQNLALNDKQIKGVFKRFKNSQQEIIKIVNTSFLSEKMKENYIKIVSKRAAILFN
ncbi:type II toxin-antitoxin system HipA family toxin [Lutibacter sp. HS1-25]|uniref:HipA domain-containing protein n=1 Tax=Lutibacter sp. HS1-25 TaxID=2485000 RepID=UPI001013043C|nr:HipA domain-containing protein [Lutibacter sp. HS1-25]RXP46472.1 type II toxin-antitoxin system HipA family toxin [Lutibacter sp. HS1-25]